MRARALADAARDLAGFPFRFQGRNPQTGLDCIGVLETSLRAAGMEARLPRTYALRARRVEGLNDIAARLGFAPRSGTIAPRDVIFCRVGPVQFHLMIAVERDLFVHAHAGIGRVVLSSRPDDWPIVAHWRHQGSD